MLGIARGGACWRTPRSCVRRLSEAESSRQFARRFFAFGRPGRFRVHASPGAAASSNEEVRDQPPVRIAENRPTLLPSPDGRRVKVEREGGGIDCPSQLPASGLEPVGYRFEFRIAVAMRLPASHVSEAVTYRSFDRRRPPASVRRRAVSKHDQSPLACRRRRGTRCGYLAISTM